MKKARWLLLVLVLLLAGGVVWWISVASRIRLIFVRYHEENGERFAVLRLENHASHDIVYPGSPGNPSTHFRMVHSDSETTGPGPGITVPRGNNLKPGECIEFHSRLRLAAHQLEVTPPFQVGVKFITPFRIQRQIYMETLGVPRSVRPPIEDIIWTDLIEK